MFCSIDIYSLKERKTGLKNAYIIYLIHQSHLHEKKKNKLTPDIITLIFFL